MKRSILMLILLISSLANLAFLEKGAAKKVKEGNEYFLQENYQEALLRYNDAQLDDPVSPEIVFNMGDVFYRQRKYKEAVEAFAKSMERGDRALEAKAFYNVGNSLFQQGRLREALEAYKQAIERDPDDEDAKYNLEYTERKMKEMLSQAPKTKQQALQDQREQKEQQQEEKDKKEEGEGGAEQPRIEEKESEGAQPQQQPLAGSEQPEQQKQAEQESRAEEEEVEGQEREQREQEERKAQEQGAKPSGQAPQSIAPQEESFDSAQDEKDVSKEQAEQYLSAFERNQQNLIPPTPQKFSKGRRIYVKKDW